MAGKNADDFGYSHQANMAIIKQAREKKVAAISLLVNFSSTKEAVRLYKENNLGKSIPLGLHFNIVEGKNFSSLPIFLLKIVFKRVSKEEVRKELEFQIKTFKDYFGFFPHHLDSHQNVHLFAPVNRIFQEVASKYKIRYIRQKLIVEKRLKRFPLKFIFFKFYYFLNKIAYKNDFNNFQEYSDFEKEIIHPGTSFDQNIIVRYQKDLVIFIFLLALIGGFFLRARLAVLNDLWIDEVSIFQVSRDHSPQELLLISHWDKSHPQLYYLFIHFWQKISATPFFLRLPTLLSFFPSVFLIFAIVKILSSPLIASLSALLFSFNPFFVDLGWQMKMYGLEIFFILASLFFTLKALKEKKEKWAVDAVIFNTLAFYNDYSSFWYFLCFFPVLLWFALKNRKENRRIFRLLTAVFFFSFLLFSPQLPIFLKNLPSAFELEGGQQGKTNLATIIYHLYELNGLLFEPQDITIKELILNFSPFLIGFFGFLALFKQKNQEKQFAAFLFGSLALFPFWLAAFLSFYFSLPVFVARNLFIVGLMPALGFPLLIFGNKRCFLGLLVSVFLFSFYLYHLGIGNSKIVVNDPLPHAFNQIKTPSLRKLRDKVFSQPGEKLIVWVGKDAWVRMHCLRDYYLQGFDLGKKKEEANFSYEYLEIESADKLNGVRRTEEISEAWIFYFPSGAWQEGDEREQQRLIGEVRIRLDCQNRPCFEQAF